MVPKVNKVSKAHYTITGTEAVPLDKSAAKTEVNKSVNGKSKGSRKKRDSHAKIVARVRFETVSEISTMDHAR